MKTKFPILCLWFSFVVAPSSILFWLRSHVHIHILNCLTLKWNGLLFSALLWLRVRHSDHSISSRESLDLISKITSSLHMGSTGHIYSHLTSLASFKPKSALLSPITHLTVCPSRFRNRVSCRSLIYYQNNLSIDRSTSSRLCHVRYDQSEIEDVAFNYDLTIFINTIGQITDLFCCLDKRSM